MGVSVSGHWDLLFECCSHCHLPQPKQLLLSGDMMICPLAPVVLGRNTHRGAKLVARAASGTEADRGGQTWELLRLCSLVVVGLSPESLC